MQTKTINLLTDDGLSLILFRKWCGNRNVSYTSPAQENLWLSIAQCVRQLMLPAAQISALKWLPENRSYKGGLPFKLLSAMQALRRAGLVERYAHSIVYWRLTIAGSTARSAIMNMFDKQPL